MMGGVASCVVLRAALTCRLCRLLLLVLLPLWLLHRERRHLWQLLTLLLLGWLLLGVLQIEHLLLRQMTQHACHVGGTLWEHKVAILWL